MVEARQNILDEVAKLSSLEHDQVFLGVWSIKDLLAHLIGWDRTTLRAVKSVLKGELPSFYKYHDRDWQTYNAMLVKKHKKDSVDELLAEARASQAALLKFLQTVPPEQFNKDFGVRFHGYRVTIQRLLEADIEDDQIHRQQIANFHREAQ